MTQLPPGSGDPHDYARFRDLLKEAETYKTPGSPFTGTEELVLIMGLMLASGKRAAEGDEWRSVLERELRILDGTATDDEIFG
ncbi:MAG: hypothetical protein JWP75_3524 [Frondihabitans sp.]|nr:hypothetical protein [Frondihabitans sp.]